MMILPGLYGSEEVVLELARRGATGVVIQVAVYDRGDRRKAQRKWDKLLEVNFFVTDPVPRPTLNVQMTSFKRPRSETK
jgi:hypothetical protein